MPSIVVRRASANTTAIVSPSEAGPAASGWRTFLQLQTEVARRMGGRADLDTDALKLHINEAYVELCSLVDFLFLHASMSWTAETDEPLYALPSCVREVVSLQTIGDSEVDNEGPLDKVDMEEYRRMAQDSTDYADKPSAYTISPDNTLALWRRPDEAYVFSMEVKLRPERLVNDNDYPVLPDEWIEPLTLLCVSKTADGLNEIELASQRYNQVIGMLRSKRNEHAERKEGTKGGVWIPRSADELRRTSRGGYR